MERPWVNLLVLFISECGYKSCRFRQGGGSGKVSSFSVYWTRLHGAVYKIGKGVDCWVKCLFVFHIGVCKPFNRNAYTEPPVVRGKEWVQFYKGGSIYHAHNLRKHPYLDHHRRCEPCTQDKIKTKKKIEIIFVNCGRPHERKTFWITSLLF